MGTAVAAQRAKAQAANIRLKYAEEENLVLKKMAQARGAAEERES